MSTLAELRFALGIWGFPGDLHDFEEELADADLDGQPCGRAIAQAYRHRVMLRCDPQAMAALMRTTDDVAHELGQRMRRRGRCSVSQALLGDSAEKLLAGLTASEQAAVESVCRCIGEDPDSERARGLPDADPRSSSWAVDVLPEATGGRGVSVIYRYDAALDAVLVLWLIAGP
ncbi:hypothetical protein ABZ628_21610 [Streptomyces diastaticus]|uniref:hypothetical protein n=1 Tax=Streptomyces diastaticus TaxID=1956 RepID=UPI0033EE349F